MIEQQKHDRENEYDANIDAHPSDKCSFKISIYKLLFRGLETKIYLALSSRDEVFFLKKIKIKDIFKILGFEPRFCLNNFFSEFKCTLINFK